MYTGVNDCGQELNYRLQEIRKAALARQRDTSEVGCARSETAIPSPDVASSQPCQYELTDALRRHLQWVTDLVTEPLSTVAGVWTELARPAELQAGLDLIEHPVNIDSEARSAEFAQERSLEVLFPDMFQDIGEIFG